MADNQIAFWDSDEQLIGAALEVGSKVLSHLA
jgi:hypothetical protein